MQSAQRLPSVYRKEALWLGTPGKQSDDQKLIPDEEFEENNTHSLNNKTAGNYFSNAYEMAPMVNINEVTEITSKAVAIMPGLPTFVGLYAKEMNESLDHFSYKLFFAGMLSVVMAFFGPKLSTLVTGLFIIAVVDLVLGLIPRNVTPGTENDQKIQAKLVGFATNFLVLLAVVKGGEYLREFNEGNGFFGFISNNIHYAVACWIFSIYLWRVVRYAANANNTRIPARLRKLFDKDVSS